MSYTNTAFQACGALIGLSILGTFALKALEDHCRHFPYEPFKANHPSSNPDTYFQMCQTSNTLQPVNFLYRDAENPDGYIHKMLDSDLGF